MTAIRREVGTPYSCADCGAEIVPVTLRASFLAHRYAPETCDACRGVESPEDKRRAALKAAGIPAEHVGWCWDGTHGTAQVTDADDNAITDAVVMGAGDNDVKRAGEIYDANYVEAGTLKLVTAAGAGSVGDVEVYIQCVRVS